VKQPARRRGWTGARSTRWRPSWPTPTCGSARRRSSPWADRGPEGAGDAPCGSHNPAGPLPARLHAIWGARPGRSQDPGVHRPGGSPCSTTPIAEVRAQAAKVAGDSRAGRRRRGIDRAPRRPERPRPASSPPIGLGKLRARRACRPVGPLLRVLRENADADAYLRHAAVLGLAGDRRSWCPPRRRAADPSASVRLGVLLALRAVAEPRDRPVSSTIPSRSWRARPPWRSTTRRSPRRCPPWPRSFSGPDASPDAPRPPPDRQRRRPARTPKDAAGACPAGRAGRGPRVDPGRGHSRSWPTGPAPPGIGPRDGGLWRPIPAHPCRGRRPARSGRSCPPFCTTRPGPSGWPRSGRWGRLRVEGAGPLLLDLVADARRPGRGPRRGAPGVWSGSDEPRLGEAVERAAQGPRGESSGSKCDGSWPSCVRRRPSRSWATSLGATARTAERQGGPGRARQPWRIAGADAILSTWLDRLHGPARPRRAPARPARSGPPSGPSREVERKAPPLPGDAPQG